MKEHCSQQTSVNALFIESPSDNVEVKRPIDHLDIKSIKGT